MSKNFSWNPGQRDAIDQIDNWIKAKYPLAISLTGAAGTGKTSVLAEIRKLFGNSGVAWTAMTGKAALRVSELVGVESSTLHAKLYKRPHQSKSGRLYFNKIKDPECDYLVIDEASMLPPKIYEDLKTWMAMGVPVLFVGDGYQLPPVMTPQEEKDWGADFSVFREVDGPSLTRVMRSGDGVIDAATQLREYNRVPKKNTGSYNIRRSPTPGMDAVQDYLNDDRDHIVITWRNQLRMAANRLIRKKKGLSGILPQAGEPIIVCKNNSDVLNGEIHYVADISPGPKIGSEVICEWMATTSGHKILVNTQGRSEPMDGFMPSVSDWKEFGREINQQKLPDPIPITYGYVSTAHKAQGSEYDKVTVFLASSDMENEHFRKDTTLPSGECMPFSTRWMYTSLTRSRSEVSLILGT